MNQIQLSKKLGVTQSYISKYLRGERGCSLQTARRLTEIFGLNPLFWMESTSEQRRAIIGKGSQAKQNLACAPDENPEAERRAEERRSGDRRKSCVPQCD